MVNVTDTDLVSYLTGSVVRLAFCQPGDISVMVDAI
jgi:hypothetical protein